MNVSYCNCIGVPNEQLMESLKAKVLLQCEFYGDTVMSGLESVQLAYNIHNWKLNHTIIILCLFF